MPREVEEIELPRLREQPRASYVPKLKPYVDEYCCRIFSQELRNFRFFGGCDAKSEIEEDEAASNKALEELFMRAHSHARHWIQHTTRENEAPLVLERFDQLYKSCITDKLANLA